MVIDILICGMKSNGNPIVSFSDDYCLHEYSWFEIELSCREYLMQEMKIKNYVPSNLNEKSRLLLDVSCHIKELSYNLMKEFLKSETCFILFPDFMDKNSNFKLMLEKLSTNLEWAYKITHNDDVIIMDRRENPRDVLFTKI